MAKASAPGRTKTRLVPPLTFDEAAALNTAFLQDIADNLLSAARYSSIAGYAAFAPLGSEPFFRGVLPPAIGLIDACLLHFGDCLLRTIEELLARGHQSAVVLNSDSPTLPTRSWSKPQTPSPGRASASCSVLRATAATIFSASKPRIAACSKTCLEHRTRRRTDPPTCPRDQARRPHTAGLVRRR